MSNPIIFFSSAPLPEWFVELAQSEGKISPLKDPYGFASDELWKAAAKILCEDLEKKRIDLATAYEAPRVVGHERGSFQRTGVDLYADLLRYGREYYVHRLENNIIDHNNVLTKNRILFDIGCGSGEQIARVIRTNGLPKRVVGIDRVFAYLEEFKREAQYVGLRRSQIGTAEEDFFSATLLKRIKEEIRKAGDTPASFFWLGNTALNFPPEKTAAFLRSIYEIMRSGDIFYFSADSTLDKRTLEKAYTVPPFKPWLLNGAHFTLEKTLNLRGFDPDKVGYAPIVTVEGSRHTVNFNLINKARQELYPALPMHMRQPPEGSPLRRITHNPVVINPNEFINLDGSSRYPENYIREMIEQKVGAKIVSGSATESRQPIRPLHSEEENKLINHNWWALEKPAI